MNEKLSMPPFLNTLGMEILANVTQADLSKWLIMQTKIINEYRLDLSESDDRKKLLKQMRIFLKLGNDHANESVVDIGNPS